MENKKREKKPHRSIEQTNSLCDAKDKTNRLRRQKGRELTEMRRKVGRVIDLVLRQVACHPVAHKRLRMVHTVVLYQEVRLDTSARNGQHHGAHVIHIWPVVDTTQSDKP